MSNLKFMEKKPLAARIAEKLPTLIAVTTVIFAVCATLASFKAAGYGNKMVLAQTQASDQWAYYQAKSIKETLYQIQRDMLEAEMLQSSQPEEFQAKLSRFEQEVQRYKEEKKEIADQALAKEQERDLAKEHNARFGQSLIFLQIGILLSSLASINKIPYYWYASLAGGGAGIIFFLSAYGKTLS